MYNGPNTVTWYLNLSGTQFPQNQKKMFGLDDLTVPLSFMFLQRKKADWRSALLLLAKKKKDIVLQGGKAQEKGEFQGQRLAAKGNTKAPAKEGAEATNKKGLWDC